MLKKALMIAMLALGVFAGSYQASDPAPDCWPCPDVR
jgi:hypothetical protein